MQVHHLAKYTIRHTGQREQCQAVPNSKRCDNDVEFISIFRDAVRLVPLRVCAFHAIAIEVDPKIDLSQ